MTGPIAVLGAGGFIGTRLVEHFHLAGRVPVRPVVRRLNSLAGLSRFALDARVADARDLDALVQALAGCEAVVHAVAGDPATILGTIQPVYRAAQQAGVRRIVYLSSASVHGQAPAPGTNEQSALSDRQPIEYNNAKVRAERRWLQLRGEGRVEVVLLRPGIVLGPRSTWITGFVERLLSGTACLVNSGAGVCNSLYVDNLVHAVRLACSAPGVDGEAFLLGDDEAVCWADVYRPLAQALGYDLGALPEGVFRPPGVDWRARIEALQSHPALRPVIAAIPKRLRRMVYAGLVTAPPVASAWSHRDWATDRGLPPVVDLETRLLGHCAVRLPDAKARAMLGYSAPVSFAEGMRRTIGWLRFAGYLSRSCGRGRA